MKINIYKEKEIEIDLPTLIDSRFLICANSGGGKSYAVRKLLEETNDKVMSIVLDVEGEFKTLREKYDYLLIGKGGDVEINMKSASLLPSKIMELNVSTIIDISDLQKQDRIRYVKAFLESLMQLPREFWKPCLIILDEAHLLCGQQEKQDSFLAVIDLMTRGRKRGYCGVLCSQRIAKLHKDAVAECNNYMIGRTGLDIDMKRASEILGFTTKQDMLSLRDLDAGEFYVFGTAISKKIINVKVGEVKTTHPKVGMDIRTQISPPTDKVKSILSKLNDLPREADQERKDKESLIKQVNELNREIRILKTGTNKVIDEKAIENAKKIGYNDAKIQLQKELDFMKKENNLLINREKKIAELLKVELPLRPIITDIPIRKVIIERPKIERTYDNSTLDSDTKLGRCERMIYSFLYNNPERTFNVSQIGAVTGYSSTSGGFNNALSRLRTLNLIKGQSSALQVNEFNPEIVIEGNFEKENIINILGKCEKEIYQVLLDNPDSQLSKEEIASMTQTNYSANSGGFNNSISRLSTLGLIKRNGGIIQLNPELNEL